MYRLLDVRPYSCSSYHESTSHAPIKIDGAVLIRLSGVTADGSHLEAAAMANTIPDANACFLSKDAMIQLGIVSSPFPQIGSTSATESAHIGACKLSESEDPGDSINSTVDVCGRRRRSLPPSKPKRLPLECTPKNTDKMKSWLIERYASSTLNQCPPTSSTPQHGRATYITPCC